MAYTKVHEDWIAKPATTTPIRQGDLEHMEQGIFDAAADADQALLDAAAAAGDAANKVDKTADPFKVYITDPGGNQAALDWALVPDPLTVAIRDAAGQLQVGNPVIASDAVNLFTLNQKVITFFVALARAPYTIWHGALTVDAFGATTSANVIWPDSTPGVYTGVPSATFPGSIDSWDITYGVPTQFTFRQTALSRDANGNVVFQPSITIF